MLIKDELFLKATVGSGYIIGSLKAVLAEDIVTITQCEPSQLSSLHSSFIKSEE